MSKVSSLKDRLVTAAGPQPAKAFAQSPPPPEPGGGASVTPIAKARQGKTMIAGYFSPEFAKAVKMLAVERDLSVQAILGEALDGLLRQHGKHPFGER